MDSILKDKIKLLLDVEEDLLVHHIGPSSGDESVNFHSVQQVK